MRIDIVFDTICPWCYIGKRRLETALTRFPRLGVQPQWHPFLLNPDMPPDGSDRGAYLARKFGSEARLRRIHGTIGDAGQSVDIDFAFERIGRIPNTVDSHRLVRFAERAGKADAAVEALFYDYFVNGKDIGDTAVLLRVGANLGLDTDRLGAYLDSDVDVSLIHDQNARAHRRGINGVPCFLIDGRLAISGAQEPPVLARVLEVALAEERAASGSMPRRWPRPRSSGGARP